MERRREEEEEEDGGESSNATYYSALWNKPIKVRTACKRVKHKRSSKKMILLRDMLVRTAKHLRRLHHERVHSTHPPLLRR